MTYDNFQKTIYHYYNQNKRSFPWRETADPYLIMVSEFMLQQTQTHRVLPKYVAFVEQFPDLQTLAVSPFSLVLKYWSGLGYNSRAKRLHDSAKVLVSHYSATVPRDTVTLESFPGIGPYTANAIATFSFNQPNVFIETNIRTVYLHFFFKDQSEVTDKQISQKVEETLDKNNPRDWYYALMDYGVYLKKTLGNQNKRSKHYTKQSKFEGSTRQLRGQILKHLLKTKLTKKDLLKKLSATSSKVEPILKDLGKEKLIHLDEYGNYSIS